MFKSFVKSFETKVTCGLPMRFGTTPMALPRWGKHNFFSIPFCYFCSCNHMKTYKKMWKLDLFFKHLNNKIPLNMESFKTFRDLLNGFRHRTSLKSQDVAQSQCRSRSKSTAWEKPHWRCVPQKVGWPLIQYDVWRSPHCMKIKMYEDIWSI